MKELLNYLNDMVSIIGYFFGFAVMSCIAVVAYYFYPTVTVIVLALTAIGWAVEFFKRHKPKTN